MLENAVEKHLVKRVKALGGVAWKFTSPGTAGVPDRIVLLPGGRVVFVELKAPGKKPAPNQKAIHAIISRLGAECYVLDSKEAVDAWV